MTYPRVWKCPNCDEVNTNSSECRKCGFSYDGHYPSMWTCPNCQSNNKNTPECDECGYPGNLNYPELWHCPKCGKLIKDSKFCPYCKQDKTGDDERIKRFALILGVFVLSLLLFSFTNKKEASKEGVVDFNTTFTSITLPSWKLIDLTNDSIRLFDDEGGRSVYFFMNKPYFTSTRKELYHVYDIINQNFQLNITSEYSLGDWEVICFSDSMFDMCLSGTECAERVVYFQYTSYESTLNNTFYHNMLGTFNCKS